MVEVGTKAPAFALPTTAGGERKLADFRGKRLVLFFYPKDGTPGCTREACGFRDAMATLKRRGAVVVGVSKDSLASHEKFRAKFELPFELLSDVGSTVAKAYGAFGEKKLYGKPVVGTIRSTFLIDAEGIVIARWSPVRVEGHVEAVLAALEGTPPAAAVASRRQTRPPAR